MRPHYNMRVNKGETHEKNCITITDLNFKFNKL